MISSKRFFPFFLLIVFVHFSNSSLAYSPRETIDSLLAELPKAKDNKSECEIRWRLAANYKLVDPEKGIYYASLARKQAKNLKWDKGIAFSNYELASNYRVSANYPEALKYLFESLKYAEKINAERLVGLIFSEIGIVYRHTGDYKKSKYYTKKGLKVNKKLDNKPGQIQNYNELAIANVNLDLPEKALENFEQAYQICLQDNQLRNAAVIIGNKGIVYRNLKQWNKSIEAFKESSKIHVGLGFDMGIGLAHQNIGVAYLNYYQDTTDAGQIDIPKSAVLDSALSHLTSSLPKFKKYDALSDIAETHEKLSQVYSIKKDYKNALANYKKFKVLRDSIDSNDDKVKVAKLGEERADLEKSQQEKITKQQVKLTELSEEKRRNETIAFIVGLSVLLIFTVFIFRERRKSERLLLNILPQSVAAELKKKGSSEAQMYNNVTVLFTDFVGFTTVSERLTPKELVSELDTCFRVFDQIMARHKIEKIKTVGDAYLAVCGLPEDDPKHAENVVNAGLDIVRFMKERKKIIGENTFEIRVGIHTGNVVAGIVGVKKFAYDIWGDTVNTAARMEQNSEPGRINISAATHERVKDEFDCTYRGELAAKNKGKLAMYFIEGKRIGLDA